MGTFIIWLVVFSICNVVSITLIGDRSLISGNLFNIDNIIKLIFNWKFITAMAFAVFSRISFIMINNSLLKIPKLANSSTSITTFVTSISLILVLIANYYFLQERLNTQQILGAGIIMIGTIMMVK